MTPSNFISSPPKHNPSYSLGIEDVFCDETITIDSYLYEIWVIPSLLINFSPTWFNL